MGPFVSYHVKHNRSLKVAVQGPDLMAHPSYIHITCVLTTFLEPELDNF
jgi:hypothetical protein